MKKTWLKLFVALVVFIGFYGMFNLSPRTHKASAQFYNPFDKALSNYIELYDVDYDLIKNAKGLRVILYYYTNDEICLKIANYANGLVDQYPSSKIHFYKVNAAEQKRTLDTYAINYVPFALIFQNGVKKTELEGTGAVTQNLHKEIDQLLADPKYEGKVIRYKPN